LRDIKFICIPIFFAKKIIKSLTKYVAYATIFLFAKT